MGWSGRASRRWLVIVCVAVAVGAAANVSAAAPGSALIGAAAPGPVSGIMSWTGAPSNPVLHGNGCIGSGNPPAVTPSHLTGRLSTFFTGGGTTSVPVKVSLLGRSEVDPSGIWQEPLSLPLPNRRAPSWATEQVVRAEMSCVGANGHRFTYRPADYQMPVVGGAPPGVLAGRSFTVPGPFDYTVPVGACGVTVDLIGGAGGHGAGLQPGSGPGGVGGAGDEVLATIGAAPGEVLHGVVAGRGLDGAGGIGGGGAGGRLRPGSAAGGGGGGASDVRRGTASIGSRVLVAGGGGGGSATATAFVFFPQVEHTAGVTLPGVKGGAAGRDGTEATVSRQAGVDIGTPVRPPEPFMWPGSGGGGATVGGPGAAGTAHGLDSGSPGSLAVGGDGAGGTGTYGGGGGGGGGRYGGGGGAAANEKTYSYIHFAQPGDVVPTDRLYFTDVRAASAGGGGSSWVAPGATHTAIRPGVGTGDGRVTFSPLSGSACPGGSTPGGETGTVPAAAAQPVTAQPRFTG
ncbi:MAG: Glycine rich protein [Acidimicrobiales bacterium]|nr:Glycine rich protein [Acidimicrobiales bacterium]